MRCEKHGHELAEGQWCFDCLAGKPAVEQREPIHLEIPPGDTVESVEKFLGLKKKKPGFTPK